MAAQVSGKATKINFCHVVMGNLSPKYKQKMYVHFDSVFWEIKDDVFHMEQACEYLIHFLGRRLVVLS